MDFKRVRHILTFVPIEGVNVEAVQDYIYLRVHLDSKLNWSKSWNYSPTLLSQVVKVL